MNRREKWELIKTMPSWIAESIIELKQAGLDPQEPEIIIRRNKDEVRKVLRK